MMVLDEAVRERPADAMEARCLLHELDHLDGFVFVERVDASADLHPRKRYA